MSKFTKVKKEVPDAPVHTGMLNAFMGKFSEEQRQDLADLHDCMWEVDDNVTNCRQCDTGFSFTVRKHHCRSCGGIFCESCCKTYGSSSKGTKEERACTGCKYSESGGDIIKQLTKNSCTISGEMNTKAALKTIPPVQLKLKRGSLFPEDGPDADGNGTEGGTPPVSGYFEFINKCDNEVCAIKLLKPGNHNVIYEAPRPRYIAVPPLESVCVEFDPESTYVDLLVLYDNPHLVPLSRKIVFDTGSDSANTMLPYQAADVSPCALIGNFKAVVIYRIPCRGCNIMLKYKGGSSVERRLGTGLDRGGIFSSLVRKSNRPLIDMHTNVAAINKVFDSADES